MSARVFKDLKIQEAPIQGVLEVWGSVCIVVEELGFNSKELL